MSTSDLLSEDSLHAYDGAKKPSLQPKQQQSDTKPITTEDNWMPSPLALNCPSGLEYLTKIDKFVVNQNTDRLESKNKYLIKNDLAQKVYTAVEEYGKCCMICCNTTRPFDIRVLDFQEREVLNFHRPLRSQSCCFPCCLQSVEVTASGTLCGFIKQSWSPSSPEFRICDATGKSVLLIKGPSNKNYVGPKFKVLLSDGVTEVGHVSKLLPGTVREQLSKADHFSISFPIDLDVSIKAVLLAASILIDCLFYKKGHRTRDSNSAFSIGYEIGFCLVMCLLPGF